MSKLTSQTLHETSGSLVCSAKNLRNDDSNIRLTNDSIISLTMDSTRWRESSFHISSGFSCVPVVASTRSQCQRYRPSNMEMLLSGLSRMASVKIPGTKRDSAIRACKSQCTWGRRQSPWDHGACQKGSCPGVQLQQCGLWGWSSDRRCPANR